MSLSPARLLSVKDAERVLAPKGLDTEPVPSTSADVTHVKVGGETGKQRPVFTLSNNLLEVLYTQN